MTPYVLARDIYVKKLPTGAKYQLQFHLTAQLIKPNFIGEKETMNPAMQAKESGRFGV